LYGKISRKAALHPPSSGGALFILEIGNVRSKKQPGIDLGGNMRRLPGKKDIGRKTLVQAGNALLAKKHEVQ
jgi:hypothetical protein